MINGNHSKKVETFCVLVCALNEEEHIESVVRLSLEQGAEKVIVIDDGSADRTTELARKAGAQVLRNRKNLGKGASLKRGLRVVLEDGWDAVLVVDGDGQHDPREIGRFLDTYERTRIPVLVGTRMANPDGMPIIRRWTNQFMAWVLNRLVKIYVADPPCGFRFYRSDILPFIMSHEPRFAFEFDMLIRAALRHIRIDSVRISTIYNQKYRSHVAPFRDTWLLFRVVKHHFPANRR